MKRIFCYRQTSIGIYTSASGAKMHITISDPTLRDGNHAMKHSITLEQIKLYIEKADEAGVDIIEVGHGNGLGASSLQVGLSAFSDKEMLHCAKRHIKKSKLGIHIIPGFGKFKDLQLAIDEGVDVFRVASHCTEANTTERYIQYVINQGKYAVGVLMMSHMASDEQLLEESKKFVSYGANAIVLMDSAGFYTPIDVKNRISILKNNISIPIGFHGHNNLSLAIANSLTAIEAGATIIDATIKGLGAGAGNTPLEVLAATFKRYNHLSNLDLTKIFQLAECAEEFLIKKIPSIKTINIISGLYGVFSGFDEKVKQSAKKYNLETVQIYNELGRRKVIAGQEDLVIDICEQLISNGVGSLQ